MFLRYLICILFKNVLVIYTPTGSTVPFHCILLSKQKCSDVFCCFNKAGTIVTCFEQNLVCYDS